MSLDVVRSAAAGGTLLAYGALCGAIWWRERQRALASVAASNALAGDGAAEPVLVLFASQTGQGEAIAWQTARGLHAAGTPARVLALDDVTADTLAGAQRALFIASTYGEGDAPDGASVFADKVMSSAPALPRLRYAVLALGDRQYDHFCGFGRALDAWLASTGAVAVTERIEVDNGDPAALAAWRAQWGAAEGAEAPDAPFIPWRLASRTLLNAGSAGAPVFELTFAPTGQSAAPDWQSGDLVQVQVGSDPGRPRDYSIASIPADGQLALLVRQEQHPDGTLGAASGLLTSTLAIGDTLALRVRPHGRFRLEPNAERPLLLIGNGTGLAGLRGHLRARVAAGARENWLMFGERNAAHDFLCRAEIETWQAAGQLERLDMVFSRDQAERLYVQHRLLQAGAAVRHWVARGAAIYVCGSLQGMASGVDAALREILGGDALQALTTSGRYRRDVY
ncbi:MAG: oxidoreductase [Comamonadaceae bacterium]|nr:MAG: oxidoreductase [Comamonadaceae bacterium]